MSPLHLPPLAHLPTPLFPAQHSSPKLSSMNLLTLSTSFPSKPPLKQTHGTTTNLTDYPISPPSLPISPPPYETLSTLSIQSLTGRSPLPFITSLIPLIALHHPEHSMICMLELSPQQAFEGFTLAMAHKFFSSCHLLGYSEDSSNEQCYKKTSGITQSSISQNPPSCLLHPLIPHVTFHPHLFHLHLHRLCPRLYCLHHLLLRQ